MSKNSQRRRRPQPASALLAAVNSGRTAPQQNSKKKAKKKRVAVGVGDLVSLVSPINHMTGNVAEVVQVLDHNRVVVKAMGTRYDVWEGTQWIALTYRPTGLSSDGEDLADCRIWIRKIIYARNPEPPKPPTPKKVTVLEGKDALLAELASPDPVGKNTHVVYVADGTDSEEPKS